MDKQTKERSIRIAKRCLANALQELELAILATPTSQARNDLTEINMKLMELESNYGTLVDFHG